MPLCTPTESELEACLALPIAVRMAEFGLASNLVVHLSASTAKSFVGSNSAFIPSSTFNDSDKGLIVESGKRVPPGVDSSTITRAASTRFKIPVSRISI